ncbi:MAG: putative N-acetyltransferase [Candidatus Methanofastidiosum methylothiophilum]|jgi:ribosomal protein S18 acetylase RimI-like enzyme|uniref:Putative N-acetyltransferase n=1 Tax=Candidatus Methanofastidiosum methylothiophilum TaxID=1705564 RepID=A0A150IXZ2_9EURY|nr:MAG: putative N-acetyltransferase [Candidatus Methanofastidiosum methylthiophilus]
MIRNALLTDYNEVNRLMNEIHIQHCSIFPEFYKSSANIFPKDLFIEECKSNKIYVIEIDNSVIGFAYIEYISIKDNPAIYDQKILYIIDICIDKEYRNKGYGKEMFEYIKGIASKEGCTSIKLDVYTFNTYAVKFYEAMNMKEEKIGFGYRIM